MTTKYLLEMDVLDVKIERVENILSTYKYRKSLVYEIVFNLYLVARKCRTCYLIDEHLSREDVLDILSDNYGAELVTTLLHTGSNLILRKDSKNDVLETLKSPQDFRVIMGKLLDYGYVNTNHSDVSLNRYCVSYLLCLRGVATVVLYSFMCPVKEYTEKVDAHVRDTASYYTTVLSDLNHTVNVNLTVVSSNK